MCVFQGFLCSQKQCYVLAIGSERISYIVERHNEFVIIFYFILLL